ncbi:DUF2851 family protein [Winogradskyella alexanderae]|uniref:DUF2851 family protein n=1 Tax=Winogradskyella alexanderae TaxID=2877123 RepID=A0ABS7XS41_9FLAO|nr:DUF2851 family protein [Winogradskyella alexanderae]MCA0132837.1 DUF2851 family protein [Winogradskyella alexanderae]
MQEEFLHYVWKHKALKTTQLKAVNGEAILIKNFGQHNLNSGPDFFNALIQIDNQLWAGNVEIHIKSSDWYAHNHEKDRAYDSVILHVVWEHDIEIFRRDNSTLPTLELSNYVDVKLYGNYKKLIRSKLWINCQNDFSSIDDFTVMNWLERLYIERLESKLKDINNLLKDSKNNWEAVLFKLLFKNFGLKTNGESFLSIANSIDYSVFQKSRNDVFQMEAILFGLSGLLENDGQEPYMINLKNQYLFLQRKFNLSDSGVLKPKFFRLRPHNFPTIRISQFANLYALQTNLFSRIIEVQAKKEFYELFRIGVTDFWKSHYTFSKVSKISQKPLTKSFIDLLIINTIIPIKFSYARFIGKKADDEILDLLKELKFEKNAITQKFLDLKSLETHALTSQALLELKQNYCDKNQCLRCAIGNGLIVKN